MAFYGTPFAGAGFASPSFSPYGFGAAAYPTFQPAFAPQPSFGSSLYGGWQLPAELQPLNFRQPSNSQQIFAGYGQAAPYFNAQPVYQPAPAVGGTIAAGPTIIPTIAGARPVDIYASTASAASVHSVAHSVTGSVAGSVISQGSAISAPGMYANAVRASRRRGTSYGRWKDSQNIARAVPIMRQHNPDPLLMPKRTGFKKWKDIQSEYARRGLL